MKIHFKVIIFLVLIYLIYSNQISKERNLQPTLCSSYDNCFNCSVCGEELVTYCPCKWNSFSCVKSDPVYFYYDFSQSYENCVDYQSTSIQKTYCGEIIEDTENNKLSLSLPEVNGYYGQLNLFCTYSYKSNFKNDAIFSINVERNDYNYSEYDKISLQITIVYKDEDLDYTKIIEKNQYNTDVDYVKEIIFKVECKTMYSKSPFTVNISYTKGSSNIGLVISVIVIILICIVCSIAVYYFSKKISDNARIRQQQILEVQIQRQNYINNMINNQEQNNKNDAEFIEKMLNEPDLLGKKICQKEHEKYGTNCTICLEELKIGKSEVCLTPCQHVFHYKCMSDWLRKKNSTYKCPVCNFNLLEAQKEKEKFIIKDAETIHINRRNEQGNNYTSRGVNNEESNNIRIISPESRRHNNIQINNQDD